jgi:hypothetical protein
MANEFKIKKGLIVQGSGSTILDIQGSQGQLFSVTDSLTGSLFSVNDISGMPILEAFSDDRVLIGTFNAEAIKVSGSTATITGSLLGTSSFAQTASFLASTTNAFVQGGNSFGAQALIGTNDNQNLALETSGSVRMFISSSGFIGIGTTTPGVPLDVTGIIRAGSDIYSSNTFTNSFTTNGLDLRFRGSGLTTRMTMFQTTGNLVLQDGGTFTDAGFKLDVSGSTRLNGLQTLQGTVASDTAPLGTELLTTGTGDASWTGTSFATGYTHVTGSVTTLTSTLAAVIGTFYQITYTVTGRTAGSFTISFGGQSFSGLTFTAAAGPQASTTGTLVITPTTDFDGTIVLSIRTIVNSSATTTFRSSNGTASNEIRVSNIITNTFIGLNTGRRNTTGFNNTAIGSGTLANNTTGGGNTANGANALQNNTTGTNNTANGANALINNATGNNNTANGINVLLSNTTGDSNTANGRDALRNNTTGNSNTANGRDALRNNTTGNNNTANGLDALASNTTGGSNTANGVNAGRFIADGTTANTISGNSIFLGSNTRALADNQTNQIVIGNDAIGLGSNSVVLGNTSIVTTALRGNVGIGTTTPTGRLSVTDTTAASGSANSGSLLDLNQTWNTTGTPTAIRLNVTDTTSNANSLLMDLQVGGSSRFRVEKGGGIRTSNALFLGGLTTVAGILPQGTLNQETLLIRSSVSTSTTGVTDIRLSNGQGDPAFTSGTRNLVSIDRNFSPTSGNGNYTLLNIPSTINQTGGANGITRGLFINPTLTAAADFRAIELTNNTGFGIFQSGSATNSFAGNVGIGTTTPNAKLDVNGNTIITGSLTVTQGITGSLFGTASFASTASFAPAYLPIAVQQTTGLTISFTQDRVYGTFALPETGSAITSNTGSAILGVTNLIIHSASAAPTTGSDFKKLSGSPNYVPGLNYIYCTYIADNQIIYSINQAT